MKPKNITKTDWEILNKIYPTKQKWLLKKLQKNYPVQYLIGYVDFYNTKINVNKNCLIPRFETEFLVEETIKKIKKLNLLNPKILELGTGSGCISIALKKNINCEITALDISKKALSLAKKNAMENHTKINFVRANMTKFSYSNYDVIISNPPYVKKGSSVGKEIKYEPQKAIFAPQNGLYYYDKILKKLHQTLNKPTLIAFEIGYDEKEEIEKLSSTYLPNYQFTVQKDLSGKNRYIFLTKLSKNE